MSRRSPQRLHGFVAFVVASSMALPCVMHVSVAHAEDAVSGDAVRVALEGGAPGKAVALAESLADRGFESPELAYHRGLAYASRLATPEEVPGDGGQAMAGFLDAEALGARGDVAARVEAGLKAVRSHLARKRASAGQTAVLEPSPGLRRAVLLALPVLAWLVVAIAFGVSSACAAVFAWRASEETRATRVAVATILGLLSLGFSLGGVWGQALRNEEALMVVVAPQAPLFDASTGVLTEDEPLGEGMPVRVRVGERGLVTLADRSDRALKRDQLRALHSQR